jgi:hypothetical protein
MEHLSQVPRGLPKEMFLLGGGHLFYQIGHCGMYIVDTIGAVISVVVFNVVIEVLA